MEYGIKMALSFQRGEQEGFEYFFNKIFDKLAYHAWRFVHDEELAKDFAERAFMVVWEKRHIFSHPRVIEDYLFVTVKHSCLNTLRREKFFEENKNDIAHYEIHRLSTVEADHTLIRSETKRIVHGWLSKLPPECAKIMKLMYVDGLTSREIATHLELSISTVKNQKLNGLEFIKAINEGKYKKNEVRTQIQPPPELAKIVFIEVPKTPPPKEEKPAFIPWKNRKKGRLKAEQEREWKWRPNEQHELIYEMYDNGMSLVELAVFFQLEINTLNGIIREERKSVKMKQLFLKGRNVRDIARITKVSLREAIERLNHLLKITLYEDKNRTCITTYQTYFQNNKSIQGEKGTGDISGFEAQYG